MKVLASPPESSVMLTLPADTLPEAIRMVSKAAKFYLIVHVNEFGGFLVGYESEGNCAIIKLCEPDATQGFGSFQINPDTILPVCASRKADLVFAHCDGILTFKAVKGKYSGTLNLIPLVLDVINNINDVIEQVSKQADVMNAETYTAMWTALSYAHIVDVFDPKNSLVRYIRAEGNTVEVSSFDNFHMALVTCHLENKQMVKAPFRLAVEDKYTDNLQAIVQSDERGVKFVVTDHTFSARSPSAMLFMPPKQATDGFGVARDYIHGGNEFGFDCTLPAGRLQTVVSNCCSVYKAGATIAVKSQSNSTLSFEMTTEYGEIKDEIQLDTMEGDTSFKLEPYGFLDIINLLNADDLVRLKVAQGVCYLIEFNSPLVNVMLMGSLHASSEE